MKKILHVLNTSKYSGAENVAITIIRNYSKDYEGVYLSPDGVISEWVEKDNIKFIGVKKLSILSLNKAIKEIKPDIIHAHDFTASIFAVLVSKKIPVISHLHNNVPWMRDKNLKSILYWLILGKLTRIIMVSKSISEECWFGDRLIKRGDVLGNPVDIKWIRKKKVDTEKEYDLLFAGRFTKQKNPQEFIKIINRLIKKGITVKACMIGSGELEEECRVLISSYGLEKKIDMIGFVKEPFEYMSKSKILVMPSNWEGFGLVAVEAMALGVPVIANPVGGLQNIVTDENGFLNFSIEEKTREIEQLLQNEKYYLTKCKNSLIFSETVGQINEYMVKLNRCYEQCEIKKIIK